jgi:uncharacterized protein YecE (DUF72 family)
MTEASGGDQISLLPVRPPAPVRGKIYVGTCSWAEKSFAKSDFYPQSLRSPQDRLRYYTTQFPTVEVDASYFALLPPAYSRRWAEDTPDGFVMHVKAFGLFTGHAVSTKRLPPGFSQLLSSRSRGAEEVRIRDVPEEFLNACWDHFRAFLAPLAQAGRLGYVLFQLPPGTRFSPDVVDAMRGWTRELGGFHLAVEFRHRDWSRHPEALDALSRMQLAYVMVDLPDLPWLMPAVEEVTAEWAVVRFHGRNRAGWARAGASTEERYDYNYSDEELSRWAQVVDRLAGRAGRVFAMFNNHVRGNMARNARTLQALLGGGSEVPPASRAGASREESPPPRGTE